MNEAYPQFSPIYCEGMAPNNKGEAAWLHNHLSLKATDQCTDDADLHVWATGGCANFQSDMSSCGKKCLGGGSCTANCVKGKEGYSQNCSNCMGQITSCTKSNCMWKCAGGNSPSCTACVDKYCT